MTDSAPRAIPAGARLGTLLGFTSWAVVLGAVVASAGKPWLGLELAALGVASGLGLGQLALRATAASSNARRQSTLWGSLLVSVGVLLLVWGIGMAPQLAADPELYEALGRVGGTAVMPLWACAAVIAIGAALLSLPDREG